jgi:hypothetical protein
MSLRLEIKKKMVERSPRVKAIDFHANNSWVVLGLYSGTLVLNDYSNNVSIISIRPAFGPFKHLIIQFGLLSFYHRNIGSYQGVMTSRYVSSTTILWRKLNRSKLILISSGP